MILESEHGLSVEVEGKSNEQDKQINRLENCEFGRAVARIAVAQVCESIGFETFCESALVSLGDIAVRYIVDLGRSSKFYANVAGRVECNVLDVVQGLEDLSPTQGLVGASQIHFGSIVNSGSIRELKEYVDTAEEIPFAKPLPKFSVAREPKLTPSFLRMGETPSSKHIPAWLPAFPDPHTYVRTPVWNERVSDPRADKIELARQHRKAEWSLLNLHQRLVGLQEGATASSIPDDGSNTLGTDKTEMLFPAQPFHPRDKDASVFSSTKKLLDKNHEEKQASLLQTFAPAIEALKDGLDSGSDGENAANPSKRASVLLVFKSCKRMFGEPSDLRNPTMVSKKMEPWFGHDDERDDKKRRVEFLLRQHWENHQDLPQL